MSWSNWLIWWVKPAYGLFSFSYLKEEALKEEGVEVSFLVIIYGKT